MNIDPSNDLAAVADGTGDGHAVAARKHAGRAGTVIAHALRRAMTAARGRDLY